MPRFSEAVSENSSYKTSHCFASVRLIVKLHQDDDALPPQAFRSHTKDQMVACGELYIPQTPTLLS